MILNRLYLLLLRISARSPKENQNFKSQQSYKIKIHFILNFQFVSHPNVQQLLASIWYEGLPGFRRKNMALQSLEICRIGE